MTVLMADPRPLGSRTDVCDDTIAARGETDLAEVGVVPGGVDVPIHRRGPAIVTVSFQRNDASRAVMRDVFGDDGGVGVIPPHTEPVTVHHGVVHVAVSRMERGIPTQLHQRVTGRQYDV